MDEIRVRVFVSSPSDVRPERDRVSLVAERLSGAFEGVARFEAVRWEEGFYSAAYNQFAELDDFEKQIDACLRQWLEDRGIITTGPVWDRRLQGSPFRGLAPFEPSHASVFFGRETAIARIIGKLRSTSFLLLIGASGAGKSSLLRAGLLPRIVRPGVMPEVDLWRTVLLSPGKDPAGRLAEARLADTAFGSELR